MTNLKPCPFCGGEAEVKKHNNRFTEWWQVFCTNCHITQCGSDYEYEYEYEAAAAWNTRKPMESVVTELEKEYSVSYQEVGRCIRERSPEIHIESAYLKGISKSIEIVRNVAEEEG